MCWCLVIGGISAGEEIENTYTEATLPDIIELNNEYDFLNAY